MHIDRNGLEVLDREESLALLSTQPIGRVVVSMNALPAAVPVNYAVMDGDVVFRTGPGTKLSEALDDAVVAFEVDQFESTSHVGWSVLITGHASEITDPDELERVQRLPLEPWIPTHPTRYVRVRSQLISGRRLSLNGRAAYRAG